MTLMLSLLICVFLLLFISGTGCGKDQIQESRWAKANGGFFGGYPTSSWFPATAAVWAPLRGVMSEMITSTAIENQGDTMSLLQLPDSEINLGTSAIPFGGMMDRLYWIVNSTAKAYIQEVALGTVTPNVKNTKSTWVREMALFQWRVDRRAGVLTKEWDYQWVNRNPPAGEQAMEFSPPIDLPSSQCFAGHNPTNISGPGTIGRGSGPSGVYW